MSMIVVAAAAMTALHWRRWVGMVVAMGRIW